MLSPTGDYTFGSGEANFWINDAPGVAQSVRTRLLLFEGEWFLDLTEGTPYAQEVLGYGTASLYDQAIKTRVLETPGVASIANYNSQVNPLNRALTVTMTINTIYGQAEPITVVIL